MADIVLNLPEGAKVVDYGALNEDNLTAGTSSEQFYLWMVTEKIFEQA